MTEFYFYSWWERKPELIEKTKTIIKNPENIPPYGQRKIKY